ncbi:MAG: cobalamin biosynthesis protein CbiM [Deltaproteobacteria bacterium HGW-Deltaproteobacteria-19]|jgi:cobalt/nickel transport system permease protein|nr:MAG: cobalamin biosynthesis protein CbiM [Deltaproteobacteria bacterium HGW-Deltaproteobacteria-19]
MHMADALISPAVGGTMWAVTAGLTAYSAKKIGADLNERIVPLMGVLGAFVFAAQMINFTIPATGSSGHLGGGMILAMLLGPHAAFLTMASVLAVQALFFADGGLLALGCNIFNLGFFPCFVAYPFLCRRIVGANPSAGRILAGAMLSSIVALQLGAFAVVLETVASGISELPFTTFALLMQPIHLAIGVVEGLVTAAVITFVWSARPEVLHVAPGREAGRLPMKKVLVGLVAIAVLTGGVLSWFASTHPDGLEWSMLRTAGTEELSGHGSAAHAALAGIQEKIALLPDYGFRATPGGSGAGSREGESWPDINAGRSVAGIVGGGLTLLLAGVVGIVLRRAGQAGRSRPTPER